MATFRPHGPPTTDERGMQSVGRPESEHSMAAQCTRAPSVIGSPGPIRLPKHNTEQLTSRVSAICFAIEQVPPDQFVGAYLEVDEVRFGSRGIRRLHDSAQCPLVRCGTG